MSLKSLAMPIPSKSPSSKSSNIVLTPEQERVLSWVEDGKGSAFIEAVAGSGKTSTLVSACRKMTGSIAFTAFNKKIADEIKHKLGSQLNVRVGTFHSFGLAAWRNVAPYCTIDEYAKSRQMHEAIDTPWIMRGAVNSLVSIAKQSMVGKEWDVDQDNIWSHLITHYDIMLRVDDNGMNEEDRIEELIYYAKKGIQWSMDVSEEIIDFDDMIWLPLLKDAPVHQYDWVLVDEAQDTNVARRLLARRMLKSTGRALFVGDRYQAIYGFTGADSNAVDRIITEFNCERLPLTVTFRCSKEATKLAQDYVPHIVAAEDNEEGNVIWGNPRLYFSREVTRVPTVNDSLEYMKTADPNEEVIDHFIEVSPLHPGDAILCRNTKPLVSLAFQLIRQGIPCHVEGRDIGKSLDMLASKWKALSVTQLIERLEDYRRKETDKLVARDARYAIEALNDRIDTLLIIAEGCDTLADIKSKINTMFQDSYGAYNPTVVLSTIHKAKGREWDRVFILGWGTYMPSKWARQGWEIQQERNVAYVAVTRCKRDLILTGAVEQ